MKNNRFALVVLSIVLIVTGCTNEGGAGGSQPTTDAQPVFRSTWVLDGAGNWKESRRVTSDTLDPPVNRAIRIHPLTGVPRFSSVRITGAVSPCRGSFPLNP